MKERPILYSTPMVQATLAGRKKQTRRVIKPQPLQDEDGLRFPWATFFDSGVVFTWDNNGIGGENWISHDYPAENKFQAALKRTSYNSPCPYGNVGDILWGRETLVQEGELGLKYFADNEPIDEAIIPEDHRPYRNYAHCKIPSIHMPKYLSRIWERITSIRVERLQDISEEDAIAEGLTKISKDRGITYKYGIPDRDGFPGTDDFGWPWHQWDVDPIKAYRTLWESINGPESWELNPWVWVIESEILSTTGRPSELNKQIAVR